MTVSMNERAAALVDALVADAEGVGIEVRTLESGARVVDCGARAGGGLQAGLRFAAVCMGGLGEIGPVPVVVGRRTWPGVGVSTDHPAAACLAAQYAGWKLEHDDFFAMASGPGRALARAEELFGSWPGESGPSGRSSAWRRARIRRRRSLTRWRSAVACRRPPSRS